MDFWRNLFASDFIPHGYCMRWSSDVVWLHVISDALIALSYYVIPFGLVYFVRRRRDLAFQWMFVAFGAFILACGTTHLMSIWTLWQPVYRLDGLVKAFTALCSVPVALLLIRLIPDALRLPSPERLHLEIEQRKRAEEEVRRSNVELEARVAERTAELKRHNDALQRVAYISSHDLLEPLRTVVVYSQLTQREYAGLLPPEGRENLDNIASAAKRMQALITDLLHYSRSVDFSSVPQLLPTDPNQALQRALSNLQEALADGSADIHSEKLPLVAANPLLLQQIFQNLISNALKYRKPGRPAAIRVCSGRLENGQYLFSVEDEGIGIEARHLTRIFEAFTRLHSTEMAGSGVGLAICKNIIEAFGGRIWAESRIGQGSKFCFTLAPAESIDLAVAH